jgi:hypothetical protein
VSPLLAIRLTDDGKGIIANDPVTGRQVILAYDPDTRTVGAITGIFNPATKAFVPIVEAGSVQVAGDPLAVPDVPAVLQSFAPAGYFAVTIN